MLFVSGPVERACCSCATRNTRSRRKPCSCDSTLLISFSARSIEFMFISFRSGSWPAFLALNSASLPSSSPTRLRMRSASLAKNFAVPDA